MRKGIIIGLSLFALVSIRTNLLAQVRSSSGEITYYIQYSIRYAEHDTALSEDGKILIDTLFQRIIAIHKDTLSFFNNREIILNSLTTKAEREKNRLIGMQRCFIILDYIEKKYGVRRSKLLIRDFLPDPNNDSEVGLIFPPPRAPRTK